MGLGGDTGFGVVGSWRRRPKGRCALRSSRLRAREGEYPKEGEGQESQGVVRRRNPEAASLTGEGRKPLKRGRAKQQCLVR